MITRFNCLTNCTKIWLLQRLWRDILFLLFTVLLQTTSNILLPKIITILLYVTTLWVDWISSANQFYFMWCWLGLQLSGAVWAGASKMVTHMSGIGAGSQLRALSSCTWLSMLFVCKSFSICQPKTKPTAETLTPTSLLATIKIFTGSRFYLQANYQVNCHNFTYALRRHETKDNLLLTPTSKARVSAIFALFSKPQFP